MVSSLDMKALSLFLRKPVSSDMVQKLVVKTLQVIPCKESKAYTARNGRPLPSLMTFITRLVSYTNVYTGTLMATLVLLDKLKSRIPRNAQGLPCTRHRIFLSCLILAAKFHNDSSPKNTHWARYTDGLFSLDDVNLMERQLLFLLNWDIRVRNDDMVTQLAEFLLPIKEKLLNTKKMQRFLEKQQALVEANVHCLSPSRGYESDASTCFSPMGYTPTRLSPREPSHMPMHRNSALHSISRSSSTASALSLDHFDAVHGRHSLCSSVGSISPILVEPCRKSHTKDAFSLR